MKILMVITLSGLNRVKNCLTPTLNTRIRNPYDVTDATINFLAFSNQCSMKFLIQKSLSEIDDSS